MNWKGKKALVTGAGGFIGSHLVEELKKRGAQVTAFIRYTSRASLGMLEFVDTEGVDIVFGDLRDFHAIREAQRDKDVVFHLGAVISIPYSYIHPREVIEVNILSTLNILEAAREIGTPNIVVVSTSEVFGTAQYTPIDEKHPKRGQSPYAASKIAVDEISRSFHLSFGLPVKIIRPFNTFGPRQSQRAVIPTIIVQALKGEKLKLGNLHTVRDFTYVLDTVNGIIRCAEVDEAVGKEINLGTGKGYTVEEVAKKILEILGKPLEIEVEEWRIRPEGSEVEKLIADNSLAKNLLKWKPEVDFEEGLKRTIDWFKNNLQLYRREIP